MSNPESGQPKDLTSRLKRQMKRHLGIQDGLDGASQIINKIGSGATLAEDDMLFAAGFLDFLYSIDASYAESDDKTRMSVRNLEISSAELNQVNNSLKDLNQKINAMLDSLGQGLLFFNKQGICSDVFSKSCLDIFGETPSGKHLKDVLHLQQEQNDDLEMWLSIVFDENTPLDFNDLKNLAPQSYKNSKNQYIELDYRPLYMDGKSIDGILCIATDKTFEISAKDELSRKQDEAAQIRMIASNRNEFRRFISSFDDYAAFIKEQKTKLSDTATLITHLHNFKGMSGVFRFTDLVKEIHQMENWVKVKEFDEFVSAIPNFLDSITEQKKAAIDIGTLLFGDNFINSDSIISIDFDKLNTFRDILKDKECANDTTQSLLKTFDSLFLTVKISECLKPFQMELDRVTASQNKPTVHMHIDGGDTLILPKKYNEFFDSLMHLSRNIVDHGIDGPETRAVQGKTDHGNVLITISIATNNRLNIVISDDGSGLSADSIAVKLKKMGKFDPSENADEIIQHIFDSDFSIRDEASLVSGRGVGMYAVKLAVENMGGSVFATNVDGNKGAQFEFNLPYYTA